MDHWKRFWNVFIYILSFVIDVHVLRLFSLYHKVNGKNLFVINCGQEDIRPYLIDDKGYHLLP
jgi:hypothetical protein